MTKRVSGIMDSLAQLVATPSVSSADPALDQSNKRVVEILANWLEDVGFGVELMPVPSKTEAQKFNMIARLGEGEAGLVLAGHSDTVPFTETDWDQDPFQLTEKDNRWYGLGVCDMKIFFPLVVEAIKKFTAAELKQPLYVLATADEESSMAGAKALVAENTRLGRYALIGEPTGLRPVYMHKGILMESIKLKGRSGHSSDPALGNNALEGMYQVIGALMAWRKRLQGACRNTLFQVPVPTLNFGVIHGGDNPNRICADCELAIDLRLLPEMDLGNTRLELRQVVQEAVADSGLTVEFRSLFEGIPGFKTAVDSELVKLAEQLSAQTPSTVAFGTEAPYLTALGMDTVVLGPGDISQAHQANEYIPVDRISPMLTILTSMIEHFCVAQHA